MLTHSFPGVRNPDGASAKSGILAAGRHRPALRASGGAWPRPIGFMWARHPGCCDVARKSDSPANVLIDHLPAGQDIFYRIRFEDFASPAIMSEPQVGRFRTAPADRRSLSFIWSGDTAGQGWGIDEGRGGMRGYATMLRNRPDFFIHSGDTIYADSPI